MSEPFDPLKGIEFISNPDLEPGTLRNVNSKVIEGHPDAVRALGAIVGNLHGLMLNVLAAAPGTSLSDVERDMLRCGAMQPPTPLEAKAVEIGGGVPGLMGSVLTLWRSKRNATVQLQCTLLRCSPGQLALLALSPYRSPLTEAEAAALSSASGIDPARLLDQLADLQKLLAEG